MLLGDFHVRIAELAGNGVLAQILRDLVSRSSLITLMYQRDSFAARARMVRASPTISSGRSPFIASPTRSPAICDAGAWPSMITSIAPDASSTVRSTRR